MEAAARTHALPHFRIRHCGDLTMASDSAPTVTPLYPDALVKAPPPVPGVSYVAMRDRVRFAVDIFLPMT